MKEKVIEKIKIKEKKNLLLSKNPSTYEVFGLTPLKNLEFNPEKYKSVKYKKLKDEFFFSKNENIAYFKENVRVAYSLSAFKKFLKLIKLMCETDYVTFLIPKSHHVLIAIDEIGEVAYLLAPVSENYLPDKDMTIDEYLATKI